MEGKASKMCGTLSYAKDLVKSFAKISHNCHLTKGTNLQECYRPPVLYIGNLNL